MAGRYWWLIEDQQYLEGAVRLGKRMKDVRR
jgi:hypothetical protein